MAEGTLPINECARHTLYTIYECESCGCSMDISVDLVSAFNDSEDLAKLVLDIMDTEPGIDISEGRVQVDIVATVPCDACEEDVEVIVRVTAVPELNEQKDDGDHRIEYFNDVEILAILPQDRQTDEPQTDEPHITKELLPDETGTELLTVIVKTRMRDGYCCLGIDCTGNVKRPIYRESLSWDWSRELIVDRPYEFTLTHETIKTDLPHSNEDIIVESYPTRYFTMDNFDPYSALAPLAKESIDCMFGGHVRKQKYVVEGTDCPSFGVLSANGNDVYGYINDNMKNRVRIGHRYDLPYTGHDFYMLQMYDRDALIVLGLARAFAGIHGEYSPKRCAIIALRIVQ